MNQQIRFCRSGDGVRIAFAESGRGPPLVKSAHWLTHLDHDWTSPVWRHQHEDISGRYRLLRYDQRGTGLSDRDVKETSLERWVDDLEAVVDAAGLDTFVLLGMSQGGPIAIEYAARHPGRVSHLVLYGSYVLGRRLWRSGDDPAREADALKEMIHVGWGRDNPAYRQVFSSLFVPDADPGLVRHFNELQRLSASAENAARIVSVIDGLDVTDAARRLRVPTLVMHCEDDQRIPFDEGRQLATEIPSARFMPLPGSNHVMQRDDPAWRLFLEALDGFTGVRLAAFGADSRERFAQLTERERAVLAQLATGSGNADIASRLNLSPKTVRNYVSRILDKLSLASRGEAIIAARDAGLGVERDER